MNRTLGTWRIDEVGGPIGQTKKKARVEGTVYLPVACTVEEWVHLADQEPRLPQYRTRPYQKVAVANEWPEDPEEPNQEVPQKLQMEVGMRVYSQGGQTEVRILATVEVPYPYVEPEKGSQSNPVPVVSEGRGSEETPE